MDGSVESLWNSFRASHPDVPEHPGAVFHFCDNQGDADLCARLVQQGDKRATACSLAELDLGNEPLPSPGDLAVVTDWAGAAVAIIRTSRVDVVPFCEVTEDFAATEGEGDKSLAWWRKAHEAYYRRVLSGTEHAFSEDMLIACERFEVLLLA